MKPDVFIMLTACHGDTADIVLLTTTSSKPSDHHVTNLSSTPPPPSSNSRKLSAVRTQVRSLLDVIDAARGIQARSPTSIDGNGTGARAVSPAAPTTTAAATTAMSAHSVGPLVMPKSPIGRLRTTRKVQWQECEKCARTDHSSDEVF